MLSDQMVATFFLLMRPSSISRSRCTIEGVGIPWSVKLICLFCDNRIRRYKDRKPILINSASLGTYFDDTFVFRIPTISERWFCHKSAFFLSSSDRSFDFLTGIFYITLIEPCFNSNGVVAGIKRIVIIINDNEMFSAFLKFIQKQKNLRIMSAKTREIFHIYGINILYLNQPSSVEILVCTKI